MAIRNGAGRFERDVEQAELDAEAVRLRTEHLGYQQIADRMGCAVSTAHARVKRALDAIPHEAVEELRAIELAGLDELEQAALRVLTTQHVKVDHGRVIEVDGERLIDDAPVLAAIATIIRIKDQRAKLTGTYKPMQVEQRHTVETKSDLDREIERLLEQQRVAAVGRVEQGETEVETSIAGQPAHTD